MSQQTLETLTFLDGEGSASSHQHELEIHGDTFWKVNDSSIEDYSRRADILGNPEGLKFLIQAQLGDRDDNVGLDIAAGTNAQALRDLLSSGVLRRAIATNFEDGRTKSVRRDRRLTHIAGDITKPQTWKKIIRKKQKIAPEGLALVMHRPMGGLQQLNPDTYRGAAHLLLDSLRPGGLMFSQIPRNLVGQPRRELCDSIERRSDVAGVIVSPPKPPRVHVDEADIYAVVIKKD